MASYLVRRRSRLPPDLSAAEGDARVGFSSGELEEALTCCERRGWPSPQCRVLPDPGWLATFNEIMPMDPVPVARVLLVMRLEDIFSACYDVTAGLEWLRQRGIALHVMELDATLTDTRLQLAADPLLRAMSRIERRRSAERIRQVKHRERKRKRYLGGSRPFGYMVHDNGSLIENPLEQKIMKKITTLRKQGKSLRAIAAEVSTPMAPISFKTVQRLLQRDV